MGFARVELKMRDYVICYWLRIWLNPRGFISFLLAYEPYPVWSGKIIDKVRMIALNPEDLFDMGLNQVKALVLQRLNDTELQNDETMFPINYSSLKKGLNYATAPYLSNITNERCRWAFSRAHFDAFPFTELFGRFFSVAIAETMLF